MDDGALLDRIVDVAGAFLATTHQQLSGSFGQVTDDPRWPFMLPLKPEIRWAYLTTAALDAFDVAVGILQKRASQQAVGSIRFQMETLVIMRWLDEPVDPRERLKRSHRHMNGQLARMRHLLEGAPGDDPVASTALARAKEMELALERIALEDGFQGLKEEPDRGF
ncbi:MAG TPA: hypothetical protein VMK12_02440, partial [Anaeromyxobacteraceae bacterium]|nr:hypothetical protein [Anaeromyxobacteraceae bacterium]